MEEGKGEEGRGREGKAGEGREGKGGEKGGERRGTYKCPTNTKLQTGSSTTCKGYTRSWRLAFGTGRDGGRKEGEGTYLLYEGRRDEVGCLSYFFGVFFHLLKFLSAVDPCKDGNNGGCSDICTYDGPGVGTCSCNSFAVFSAGSQSICECLSGFSLVNGACQGKSSPSLPLSLSPSLPLSLSPSSLPLLSLQLRLGSLNLYQLWIPAKTETTEAARTSATSTDPESARALVTQTLFWREPEIRFVNVLRDTFRMQ
jgi:hypothetical protein